MKTFLAIYTFAPDSMDKWRGLSDQERQQRESAGVAAWHAWVEKHGDAVIDRGAPLGKTRRISPDGVSDITNAMTAYSLVRAETHDAAARLFEGHPHFTIFPGDGIEIMECLPVPGS